MTATELLKHINPISLDYQDWLSVGMALHYEGAPFTVWDNWSRQDRPRYREGVCQSKWKSFRGSDKPVTVATIVEIARRQGWQPPKQPEGRALDWDSPITTDGDYRIVDEHWLEEIEAKPLDIDPSKQIVVYLSNLFEPGECVGYVTETWEKDGKHFPKQGIYSRTAETLINELSRYHGNLRDVFGDYDEDVGAWVRFNPLDGEGVRDANVTDFRYALVESDSMPIEQQRGIYEQLDLPIAALVHSGNKSLHAIVRINAPDITEYRRRVDFLYEVCKKNGLEIDRQNRNPSRLSRLPGFHRGDQIQSLVAVNIGKASWDEWRDWIEDLNDDLPDPEPLASKWDNLPPLADPLIDGILRQGHKMLIVGPSKAGKSYLQIQLCAAIAEGREWLGRQCAMGRVLYVNLELDPASCLHRFRDVYQSLGFVPNHIANIDIWNLRGKAIPMDRLAPKLIRRAAKKNYLAVIIDPIYKVITGDENAADKMAHFCNQFDRVCAQLGSSVIYCHHHSKGFQGAKRASDRASGSGVFARDPDAILDLIELVVSPDLRASRENSAVCELVAEQLGRLVGDWQDHCGFDDMLSEQKMRALASSLLGERYNRVLLPKIYEKRQESKRLTAWRVDGTLREFPRFDPIDCWFDYPIHCIDRDGTLNDASPEGAEPLWKQGKRAQASGGKDRRQSRATTVHSAFELLSADGPVLVSAMAEYADKSIRTMREWINETGDYTVSNGIVTKSKDAAEFSDC